MSDVAPYGTWTSPISAADVAGERTRRGWLGWVGDELWWTESRPTDGGRVALVRRPAGGGEPVEVVGAPWNVRNRVIEYGGRPWAARAGSGGAVVVFTHWGDHRLYRLDPGADQPVPLTPAPGQEAGLRYAEPFVHPTRDEVWCVRESHTGPAPTDLTRDLVAIPLDGSAAAGPAPVRTLAATHHFLACPRLSPDGGRLSWIGWDHPSMPWDETTLCVAAVDGGEVGEPRAVTGGARQAVVQAEWTGPRTLVYISDPDGWWNLYRVDSEPGAAPPEALGRSGEEYGGPLWQLGYQWIAPLADGTVAAIRGGDTAQLCLIGPAGMVREVDSPYTAWGETLTAHGSLVAGLAASPSQPAEPVLLDVASGKVAPLTGLAEVHLADPGYLPEPAARTFRGADGRDIHANVYPPRHPGFTGPAGQAAPFMVWVHGGPTGQVALTYDLEIAFFTSRGVGVVEVNYGGSTGYGRAYRERLVHNWGVVDVADCAEVARALAAEGVADPARLAIRGGSAGGWTSGCALTADEQVYQCAIIYFPILDLAGWRTGETHDFESQYLESMVGPWPEAKDVYESRSPVNRTDRVTAPFLLLQGLEDVICPPLQCERFLARLAGRDIPHAYLTFAGEQHGFRKAESVIRALNAELSFLGQVLGFEPPGVPPLTLVR